MATWDLNVTSVLFLYLRDLGFCPTASSTFIISSHMNMPYSSSNTESKLDYNLMPCSHYDFIQALC